MVLQVADRAYGFIFEGDDQSGGIVIDGQGSVIEGEGTVTESISAVLVGEDDCIVCVDG